MAKKWTPSQKQLQLYDELLKRQNITRKRLLRRRRIIEEEGSFGRPLPDLIIPMKAKRHRNISRYASYFDSYEDYRNKIRALQQLYGKGKEDPTFSFYRSTYRNEILGLIKGWIGDYLNFAEKPKGFFGKYSEEQIQFVNQIGEDAGKFLELYNKMISLSLGEFMSMYDRGFIPRLKYIYDEIRNVSSIEFSYVDEFLDSYSDFRKQVRENQNVIVKDLSERPRVAKKWDKALRDYENKHKK